ncbi:MAG: ABC transporter permease [Acidimicrobiia bacterium]|nr:ABC transporter permease [Acidimicrobiia bacterium]
MSLAQPSGFFGDLTTVAIRALRSLLREPEALIPALTIPMFFYAVNIGALQDVAERFGEGLDFKAFQLPVAIIFAVTGVSRANVLVIDIQTGYLDKLLVTPVKRAALLLGMMVADFVLVFCLSLLVSIVGLLVGVRFVSGVGGMLAFLLLSSAWGLAFTGFPYTIALRTGNPAAVNSSFLIFFPFAFLTSSFLPLDALTSWLQAIARWNPVTYLLEGLRSLITEGWVSEDLLGALAAVAGIGVVTFAAAFQALERRVNAG